MYGCMYVYIYAYRGLKHDLPQIQLPRGCRIATRLSSAESRTEVPSSFGDAGAEGTPRASNYLEVQGNRKGALYVDI